MNPDFTCVCSGRQRSWPLFFARVCVLCVCVRTAVHVSLPQLGFYTSISLLRQRTFSLKQVQGQRDACIFLLDRDAHTIDTFRPRLLHPLYHPRYCVRYHPCLFRGVFLDRERARDHGVPSPVLHPGHYENIPRWERKQTMRGERE